MNPGPFDFQLTTRIVYGAGSVLRLGELARELGGRRVMVVSDRGIVAAGLTEPGVRSLCAAGVDYCLFDDVHENPSTDDVDAAVAVARHFAPDLLVGLGGGSSIDCAKGVNFIYTNGGRMQDYWGTGKADRAMLPMIAVPTTAGTGSEVQSYALISDAQTHAKMACGDRKAACRVALLDPQLTLTQPPHVTALAGIDALAHAVESRVSTRSTALSHALSREAWQLLATHFIRVIEQPTDLAARGAMQWGACLAGLAIENSMLGAAHGLANPLTAHFGLAHGQAVGAMLPHVIRFNASAVGPAYDELAQLGGLCTDCPQNPAPGHNLAKFVACLLTRAGLATRLTDCGVDPQTLPQLATEAARQWTTSFNPRPADAADLLSLYQQAF